LSAKYDNTDRWRHLKHFIDTHPYSEDNLEYLKTWITHFTVPPKQSKHPQGYDIDWDALPGEPPKGYEKVSDESNQYENISDYVKEKGLCLSDSPSETNTSDWCDTLPRTKKLHYD